MNTQDLVERTMSGETLAGIKVAAWRETHPEHGDKYGHRYSEHWSTPSSNPAVTVERLFAESDVLALLSRIEALEAENAGLREERDRLTAFRDSELRSLEQAETQAAHYRKALEQISVGPLFAVTDLKAWSEYTTEVARSALSLPEEQGNQEVASRSQPSGTGPSDLVDPQSQHSDGER